MQLIKRALENVKFSTRGRWYKAEQVDAFLDELTVAVNQAERELKDTRREAAALAERANALQAENARLKKLLHTGNSGQPKAPAKAPAPYEDLKREREQLIQDIKALLSLRDDFRERLERDSAAFAKQLRNMESGKVL